ncbi:aminoalkylphosphonic acid N-acetyltransferase [compost metagenome]
MNDTAIEVRQAVLNDQDLIVSLLHQLGYEITSTQVQEKLTAAESSPSDVVLVAGTDGVVRGCISLHIIPLFHAAGYLGRITSLVVDEAYRGKQIGSALMDAANDWFAARACVKIEVTSGDLRPAAHRFYESKGLLRDGQRFARKV